MVGCRPLSRVAAGRCPGLDVAPFHNSAGRCPGLDVAPFQGYYAQFIAC